MDGIAVKSLVDRRGQVWKVNFLGLKPDKYVLGLIVNSNNIDNRVIHTLLMLCRVGVPDAYDGSDWTLIEAHFNERFGRYTERFV